MSAPGSPPRALMIRAVPVMRMFPLSPWTPAPMAAAWQAASAAIVPPRMLMSPARAPRAAPMPHGAPLPRADARAAAGPDGGDDAAPDEDAAGPVTARVAVPSDARAALAAGGGEDACGVTGAAGFGAVNLQGRAVPQGNAGEALAAFEMVAASALEQQLYMVLPSQAEGSAAGHPAGYAPQGQRHIADAVRQGDPAAEGSLVRVCAGAAGNGGHLIGQDAEGVRLLLIHPVRALFAAGDGEGVGVHGCFLEGGKRIGYGAARTRPGPAPSGRG